MESGELVDEWHEFARRPRSLFSVDGRSKSAEQEQELIGDARRALHQHKLTQRLSRVDKGALADKVLHSGHGKATFADCLGALLRMDPQPLPTVTVEYRQLRITAEAVVGNAGNPSVLNSAKNVARMLACQRSPTVPHTILDGVSGVLRPGRMTLLLGPPSSGKSVLLQALSGRLRASRSLKIEGSIKYNGLSLDEFQPRRTAGLVQQRDNHLADLTVQETVDFAFRCQLGPEHRAQMYKRIEFAQGALEQQRARVCADGAKLATAESGGQAADGGAESQQLGSREAAPNGAASSNGRAGGRSSSRVGGAAGAGSRGASPAPDPNCADLAADAEFAQTMKEVVGGRLLPYLMLRIMGLSHTAQTCVGSTEQRGISGGERKRLTTAEIIVGQQSVVFMDEISTGLDSATAYSVIKTFRDVSHALQRTFLISLLQPAPEVMHLFDDLLLLTDGRVIYHGPISSMLAHFEGMGFLCPPRKDPGSFLQEVTTPAGQWLYASKELLAQHDLCDEDRAPAALLDHPPTALLMSVEEIGRVFWEESAMGRGMLRALEHEPVQRSEAGTAAVQTEPYGNSAKLLVREVVRRQFLLNWRMRAFYIARVVQTMIMALIISSMFATIDPTPEDGRNAVAVLVLSVIFLSMNSAPQLAFAHLAKPVLYKQRDNQLFPPWAFSLAQVLVQLPQSTVEAIVWSCTLYWIVGLTRTPSCFFVYLLVVWSSSNCLAGMFRLIGYCGQNMVMANSSAMLILLLMITTNGFSLVYPAIPPYMVWVYWINPTAWAVRALAINELTAARWQYVVPGTDPPMTAGDTIMEPFGFSTSRAYIWGAVGFLWGSLIITTLASALALRYTQPPTVQPTVPEAEGRKEVLRSLNSSLQRRVRAQLVRPLMHAASFRRAISLPREESTTEGSSDGAAPAASAAAADDPPHAETDAAAAVGAAAAKAEAGDGAAPVAVSHAAVTEMVPAPATPRMLKKQASMAQEGAAVPFTPIILVCHDLHYYVPDPSGGELPGVVKESDDKEIAGKLELLKGISLYACPGELTALMGGSGAGKTTLMDVVLGRKTVGVIRGDIFVNGHPKQQSTWTRAVGYVEQQDIHSGRVTVRESLMFSARLRLTEDIPQSTIVRLVDETLAMTELARLQHSIVGEGDGGQGLTVEQRKRLSIAVELVAAPAVMFLDEPTSGLDARAAAIVMRAIQNVAKSNRTVMVTIHQPSTEIFESFDQLVLMQLGGRLTYFGRVGVESSELIAYLEGQPGVERIRPGYNPATWMLEVTGGSMSTIYQQSTADFPAIYQASELRACNDAAAEALVAAGLAAHAPLSVTSQYATSFWTQRRMLLKKFSLIYFRSPHYNFVRLMMAIVIALIYGITFRGKGHLTGTEEDPGSIGDIQNVMGLLFSTAVFVGMFNCLTVMPLVAAERVVFYRERAAMLYGPGPYSIALGLAEVPYLLVQSLVMVNVVYWLVHFSHVGWVYAYYLLMFTLALMMYTLCGQFLVFATPNQLLSQLLAASLNQLWTISNGFLLPYPAIPRGWKWLNRISPSTWILYGLGESQLGDSTIPMLVFGNVRTTVGQFMTYSFDYHWSFIWWCVLIIAAYAIFFRLASSALLRFVNFQKR